MFVGVVVENFHRCREEQEKEERARRQAKRAHKMEKKRRSNLWILLVMQHYPFLIIIHWTTNKFEYLLKPQLVYRYPAIHDPFYIQYSKNTEWISLIPCAFIVFQFSKAKIYGPSFSKRNIFIRAFLEAVFTLYYVYQVISSAPFVTTHRKPLLTKRVTSILFSFF